MTDDMTTMTDKDNKTKAHGDRDALRRLTARCPWLHGADLALTPTDRRTTDAPVIHLRQTTDGQ